MSDLIKLLEHAHDVGICGRPPSPDWSGTRADDQTVTVTLRLTRADMAEIIGALKTSQAARAALVVFANFAERVEVERPGWYNEVFAFKHDDDSNFDIPMVWFMDARTVVLKLCGPLHEVVEKPIDEKLPVS